MKGIMAAKSKPIETKEIALTSTSKSILLNLDKPPQKQAGKIVSSASELVKLLHTEAKVI
jgi:electron transfer flavoprotein alpha/beta subunit